LLEANAARTLYSALFHARTFGSLPNPELRDAQPACAPRGSASNAQPPPPPETETMTRTLLSLALLAAAFAAAPAHAAGDKAAGHAKIYTCIGCHGVPGYHNAYPNYHVPKIAGQNFDYLVAALMGYKSGQREHPTMRAQGESLSEQDIQDIAAYLAGVEQK
jgi:cytochrome c553